MKWAFQALAAREAHKEEADGHFGPHKSGEGLDPFSECIFAKFTDLVGSEVGFTAAKTVVNFYKIKAGADCIAEL